MIAYFLVREQKRAFNSPLYTQCLLPFSMHRSVHSLPHLPTSAISSVTHSSLATSVGAPRSGMRPVLLRPFLRPSLSMLSSECSRTSPRPPAGVFVINKLEKILQPNHLCCPWPGDSLESSGKRKSLFPNSKDVHWASEHGHLLALPFEESWAMRALDVVPPCAPCRASPLPCGAQHWEHCFPALLPTSLICMLCHLLRKIMLSCNQGDINTSTSRTARKGYTGGVVALNT